MDADTIRTVAKIKKRGWYRLSTTMGDGGWSEVHKNKTYKTYVLDAYESQSWNEIESIKAVSDEVALKAFESLYHLEMFNDWDVCERIVEFRHIKSKGE